MLPSPASLTAFRSVIFSSTSSASTIRGSLAAFGRSASILQGELYGILAAALLARQSSLSSQPPVDPSVSIPQIYSDRLNAITTLNNALHTHPLPHSWSSLPARSLYRWILSVLRSFPLTPTLHHVRAHTDASDPASRANCLTPLLIIYPHLLTPTSSNLHPCLSLHSPWTATHPLSHLSSTSTHTSLPFLIPSWQHVLFPTQHFAPPHLCRYPFTIVILLLSIHTLVHLLLFRLSSSCIHVPTNCRLIPLFPPVSATSWSFAASAAFPLRTHIIFSFTALPFTIYTVNARLLYGPRQCRSSARPLYPPMFSPMSRMSSARFSVMTHLGHSESPNAYSCVLLTAVTQMPSGLRRASGAL
ncbi:hypothetical protein BC826DRAFT_1027341 [Russula brevipes]|nr:hypothetical protein BC826DRAFT_1027341 [Russula brevipes]